MRQEVEMTETPNPHYTVEKVETVAASPTLRAKRFTLAVGQEIPWHYHNEITDWFFCLDGKLRVETRAPRQEHLLPVGGSCSIPAKTAHRVSNAGDGRCQFLILQGVGTYDYVPVG
jgi:quercetin dioxygenase-like cupin family protein